jgi:hypothetical protein
MPTRKHYLIISALLVALAIGLLARRGRPAYLKAAGQASQSSEHAAGSAQDAGSASATSVRPSAGPPSPAASGSGPEGGATLSVTIKLGDSVTSLARHYVAQSVYLRESEFENAIRQANGLSGDRLKPGQQIVLPGIPASPIQDKPVPVPKDFEARGIYLTAYTAGSARGLDLVKQWKAAGGNTVVFDIKDYDGELHVPFDHKYAPRPTLTIHNLPKYVHYLHSLNLHAIARIALFRDQHLAETYPELAVHSRRTGKPWLENGKLAWTDPSNPAVQQYDLDLARMVAATGADEIQFDYVRFPAEGDQADCVFAFQKEHPDWPRSKVITDFVARAEDDLHPRGVLVSIDVFGVMAWARPVDLNHTGQNITELARHVDALSPMIYPSHFFGMDGYALPGDAPEHFISESMKRFGAATQGSGVVLRPWLQAFSWRTKTYNTDYILTQVRVAKDEGGVGFLLWHARNEYPRPFDAMPIMRAAGARYFRGDEVGQPVPAAAKASSAPASAAASTSPAGAPAAPRTPDSKPVSPP